MRFQYNGTKLNILLIKIHFIEHFFLIMYPECHQNVT